MIKIDKYQHKSEDRVDQNELLLATYNLALDLVNYIRETQSFTPELINAAIGAVDTCFGIIDEDW